MRPGPETWQRRREWMVLQHKSGHGNLLGVQGGEPAAQEGGIKEGTEFSFNNRGHVIC